MPLDDRKLVDRVLRGDRDAFRSLFDDQFPRLYRFALVRTNYDEGLAEDVAQATLCKAIRKLQTYRGEATLFSWLCTFCRRELWANNHGPRNVALIEDSTEVRAALESLVAGEESDPEVQLRRSEAARWVQVTLDHLPARYANALEWKYIDGFSVKQIAAQLGVSPKAAESTLTRARVAFRDALTTLMREGVAHA